MRRSGLSGANFNIDLTELTDFQKDMINTASQFKNGKHTKAFLRRTGNKGMRRVRSTAKSRVKTQPTGNLVKGIKRGRAYYHKPTNAFAVRVYAGSPAYHANLLEYGHHIILPNGVYWGYFKGYNFFRDGMEEYAPVFFQDTDEFVDRIIYEYLL